MQSRDETRRDEVAHVLRQKRCDMTLYETKVPRHDIRCDTSNEICHVLKQKCCDMTCAATKVLRQKGVFAEMNDSTCDSVRGKEQNR